MEPQIAAVVIERSLRRPLKGMPASWRRPEAVAERRRREFARRVHAFQSSLWGIWRFGQLYIRPLLPYVVVSSAVWYQRDSISHLLQSLWKSLQSARYSWSSRRPFFRARFPLPSQPSPPLSDKDKDRVDLEALNRALRQSFLEKLDLRRQARSGST